MQIELCRAWFVRSESDSPSVFRGLVALGSVLPLALGCGAEAGDGPGFVPPPVQVQVVTASPNALPVRLSAVGSLQSPETTTVASDVAGIIVFLDTPEGKRVEAQHLLAHLDDAEARAARSVAQARYVNARAELDRVQPLHEDGVVARQVLDDTVAELATAQGLLEEAETRVEKTFVRAPFAGVLGLRTAQLGQYVSSGTPIVELTRVDLLELVFTLPERHTPRIHSGQLVLGMVGHCGPRFEARINAIDPTVDPATRALRLQALVTSTGGALKPGMSARVRLVVGELPEAIVIPQEAVVRQGARHLVWVLDQEGKAQPRQISLGDFFPDGVHVETGIQAGERIVTAGHQKLRPGTHTVATPYVATDNPLLRLGQTQGTDCVF